MWGIELEDNQSYLFPPGERLIRSRSHIFSNAIIPTGDNTFDCEYALCLEIGRFPEWLARPVVVTICRDLFKYAQKYYNATDKDHVSGTEENAAGLSKSNDELDDYFVENGK